MPSFNGILSCYVRVCTIVILVSCIHIAKVWFSNFKILLRKWKGAIVWWNMRPTIFAIFTVSCVLKIFKKAEEVQYCGGHTLVYIMFINPPINLRMYSHRKSSNCLNPFSKYQFRGLFYASSVRAFIENTSPQHYVYSSLYYFFFPRNWSKNSIFVKYMLALFQNISVHGEKHTRKCCI
jgi:hypothetical protein